MKTILIIASAILLVGSAAGEEVLKTVDWAAIAAEGGLGGVEQADGVLRVHNDQSQAQTTQILVIPAPGITSARYGVIGEVKCEGVEGKGYLEMWNYFPGGGAYFSRTLAASGPLGFLSGSSTWRSFSLPFFNKEDGPAPEKLECNVVFPGKGTVFLRNVRLVQYGEGDDPTTVANAWWNDRQAGIIGGSLGALVGCLGALLGWLSSKGKARGFVMGTVMAMIVFGVASFVFGVVAVILKQPYAVYYPLLLLGGICTIIPAGMGKKLKRTYQEAELRKMHAADAT